MVFLNMERRSDSVPPANREPADYVPGTGPSVGRRLARPLEIERTWTADREAQLAALRVAIGLPRVLPSPAGGGER